MPERKEYRRKHPTLRVSLYPGDSSQEVITEFYLALSAVYRACGGSGLRCVGPRDSFITQDSTAKTEVHDAE